MRVYQFTEQPYPDAWNGPRGSLRVNLPNRKCDPKVAADLFHRYYDEWHARGRAGPRHHAQRASPDRDLHVVDRRRRAVGAGAQTKRARLLVLGYPIGHRPDPLRVAEELATIDVISRGRLDMGFVKGVP